MKGLTTTEVNDKFVKAATFATQSSYCDMLSSQGHAAVGLATVFISHVWKYLFLDVVDALLYHFQDEPDMATDGVDAMNKMLATINAEKSECWKAEDRDRIFDAVRQTVGFAGIIVIVFEQLRGWVITVTTSALGQETDKMKVLGLKSTLAGLYENQGKYDAAEPLYKECLATQKEVLGDDHPSTVTSRNNLRIFYLEQEQRKSSQ